MKFECITQKKTAYMQNMKLKGNISRESILIN